MNPQNQESGESQTNLEDLRQQAWQQGIFLHVMAYNERYLAVSGDVDYLSRFGISDFSELFRRPTLELIIYNKVEAGDTPMEAALRAYDGWCTAQIEKYEPDIANIRP